MIKGDDNIQKEQDNSAITKLSKEYSSDNHRNLNHQSNHQTKIQSQNHSNQFSNQCCIDFNSLKRKIYSSTKL